MKPRFLYFISLLILSVNSDAQMNQYSYTRQLDKVEKEDFYSIPLLPEITAKCKSGLHDIRLYKINETDTSEVPYIMEWLGDKSEESPISFELINDVTNLKCCSYITLKMSKKQVINKITLDVLENNFDKILKIEGSNDNKEWYLIKDHLRIAGFVNSENDFRSTSIHFPSAEFTYFRIEFDDDGSDKINVTGARAFENKVIRGNYNELTVKNKVQNENKKEKKSEIFVDLAANYFLSHIILNTTTKTDFYRNINIFRSTGTFHTPKGDEDAWQLISSGIISSKENNIFSLSNLQSNKLKIEVINYDNEPVTLDEIKVFSEKIVLITKLETASPVYLVYGREKADAPVYDLIHFKNKIPGELSAVNPGKEEFKIAAMLAATEPLIKSKIWLWIVMGIVILLIGYFALNMLRKG